jgi:hypothetical protein
MICVLFLCFSSWAFCLLCVLDWETTRWLPPILDQAEHANIPFIRLYRHYDSLHFVLIVHYFNLHFSFVYVHLTPVLPQSRLKTNRDQNFDRIFNWKSNLFKMILIAFRRPTNNFREIFVFDHFLTLFPSTVGVFVLLPVCLISLFISHISILYTYKKPQQTFSFFW